MERFIIDNNGTKLTKQLISLIERNENSNNYIPNEIVVEIENHGLTVSTRCCNDYGTVYYNDNETFVSLSELPNFLARKMFM